MYAWDRVKINPTKTGLGEWIEGTVLEVEQSKLLGTTITMRANDGQIFYGEEKWFKKVNQ